MGSKRLPQGSRKNSRMKVLVAVKEVIEIEDDFEIEETRIAEQYCEYDLNEWDDYAIEEAVQISEEFGDVEVVSVTIGPERSEETIRMGLAKGVDRAVRVWDEAIASQDLLDVGAKATILGAVARAEEPDLILTGVQADDDGFGATGVALASALGYEWAAVTVSLDLDPEGGAGVAHVHRELEGGVEEISDVVLPAVLTIQTGINEPRYASLRGIRQAQTKEINHQTLDDLGLAGSDVESALELTAMYEPETEAETQFFEGSAGDQAAQLAAVLRDHGVGEA